jgi:WD40 repeat protein
MGYLTRFELKVIDCDTDQEDFSYSIIREFKKESDYAEGMLDDDGLSYESGRWYGHEEELHKFSINHPNYLFILNGEGEDGSSDTWIKYFRDGIVQVCNAVVTFPPYDPTKVSDRVRRDMKISEVLQ